MIPVPVWAQTHSVEVAAVAVAVALMIPIVTVWARKHRRPEGRTPAAVVVAALAALACTAYSADTSWNFAAHKLGMASTGERAAMFAAAELALFACALMARQNLRTQGAPGTPGLLVWFITAVQVIPAYSESGFVGGTVRAVAGPVLAALLWHLAMGIELRHRKPGTNSSSLPSILGRELRERLLSRLGLATRDRTAEQITRDRATARAVQLAARPKLRRWGRARLAAAVARAGVGTDPVQLDVMMQQLAARRGAQSLSKVELRSPFVPHGPEVTVEVHRVPDVPEVYPALGVRVPAVPEAVPAGARMLPIIARPEPPRNEIRNENPVPVLAAEYPRTRSEVHAEYVPDPVPEDDDEEPVADPDPLIHDIPISFENLLRQGGTPSVRSLRSTYSIGQARAQRLRDHFLAVRS